MSKIKEDIDSIMKDVKVDEKMKKRILEQTVKKQESEAVKSVKKFK